MSDVWDERTPLSPAESTPVQVGAPSGYPRTLADALTRISASSLDCLIPGDLLNSDPTNIASQDLVASATDYGYALTSLLYYRQQKRKLQVSSELDLYGQWTQAKSSKGDVELLDTYVKTIWEQSLANYRTDQEIDTMLWATFLLGASSTVTLNAVDFLKGDDPLLSILTHPLVEASISRRWKHGIRYPSSQPSSSLLQRSDTLVSTPRNAHFIALVSHLIYLGLLAHYLLYPPNRVTTDVQAYLQVVGRYEVALFIFAFSHLIFAPSALQLTVLVALTLPFPGLPLPGDGFFDILLLIFALHIWGLHRPVLISPLFVYDLPKSIPLAGFVHQSLTSGVLPSLFYFGPTLIASIFLLSLSLDGNYLQSLKAAYTTLVIIPAPMETRNIFLLIVSVILLGLLFSLFATTVAFFSLRSPNSSVNPWDRFGTDIGYQSRSTAISACSAFGDPYLYPPPFNVLRAVIVLPLEYGQRRSGRTWPWVTTLDTYIWRLTVLPFLFVTSAVSKIL